MFRASLLTATLLVGMYPMVWYVTSGAHAVGDLAISSAVVAVSCRQLFPAETKSVTLTAMISFLLLAGGFTKISLLPVVLLIWLTRAWQILKGSPNRKDCLTELLVLALPWVVFYVPVLVWTWTESGSPFGPVLAGHFGPSIYNVQEVQRTMSSRDVGRFPGWLNLFAYDHSVLFWFFLTSFFFCRRIPRTVPIAAMLFQLLLLVALLPVHLRYLGGTQLAVVILGGVFVSDSWDRGALKRFCAAALLVPWIALQAYYSWPFLNYVAGAVTAENHYRLYIAFYDDLIKLDRLLPPDATILVLGVRPNSFYFPREIYIRRSSIPTGRPAFAFVCDRSGDRLHSQLPPTHMLGNLIYRNDTAVREVSRVPGIPNRHGELQVFQLIKRDGS